MPDDLAEDLPVQRLVNSDRVSLEARLAPHFRQLFQPKASGKCVVAVSGGPDSVALIHLMHRMLPHIGLVAAHMNHHARSGADADEQFVADLARRLDVTLEIGHFHATRKSHFEADARKARHQWLEDVAEKYQAQWVVTAHTLDDQAETVLMRLARGTGPTGLAGIRPTRKLKKSGAMLVRPLLDITKNEILQYLAVNHQNYCLDPTNQDVEHQDRAWVRHVLYPMISERLNPKLNHSLAQLASLMTEEEEGIARLLEQTYAGVTQIENLHDVLKIDAGAFCAKGEAWMRRRWLRHLWQELGWPMGAMTLAEWCRLEEWISRTDSNLHDYVHGNIKGVKEGDRAIFRKRSEEQPAPDTSGFKSNIDSEICLEWAWPGRLSLGDGEAFLEATSMAECPALESIKSLDAKEFAIVDAHQLRPPVTVRHPHEGDIFDPLGLGGKRQHVVDLLRNQGVTAVDKKRQWLVCDQEGIVWVAGHRVAERVKCGVNTKQAWLLRYSTAT